MSTIVTRAGKGSPLTHTEVDNNFTNLNTDKVEATGGSLTDPSISGNVSTTGLNFDSNTLVIDATNDRIGIGTSSPASRLSVTETSTTAGAADIVRINTASGGNFNISCSDLSASVPSWTIQTGSSEPIIFAQSSTERMRIDASGNLGLGVTPSAWGANWKGFEYGARGALSYNSSGANSFLSLNAYNDGTNFIYKANTLATVYTQSAGTHSWSTAPSGTAGNAITFTQAMTLDASGRLLVGATTARTNLFGSASANLQVEGLTGDASRISFIRDSTTTTTNGGSVVLGASKGTTLGSNTSVASGDRLGSVQFLGADGTGLIEAASIVAFVDGTPSTNDMPGRLVFSTTADGAAAPTERVRITSNGYLRMASGSLGIQFNGDTAAANSLDDYEEGTFTPTIIGTTTAGTGTYSVQSGVYTKIGNRVIFSLKLTWSAHTGTGNMRIAGLPFTQIAGDPATSLAVNASNLTFPGQLTAYVVAGGTQAVPTTFATGAANAALAMDTAAQIEVAGSYAV